MRYFVCDVDLEKEIPGVDWREYSFDGLCYEQKVLAARARALNVTPLGDFIRLPAAGTHYAASEVLKTVRPLLDSFTSAPSGVQNVQIVVQELRRLEGLLVNVSDAGVGFRLGIDKG